LLNTTYPEALSPETAGTLGLQPVSLLTQLPDGTLPLDRLGGAKFIITGILP